MFCLIIKKLILGCKTIWQSIRKFPCAVWSVSTSSYGQRRNIFSWKLHTCMVWIFLIITFSLDLKIKKRGITKSCYHPQPAIIFLTTNHDHQRPAITSWPQPTTSQIFAVTTRNQPNICCHHTRPAIVSPPRTTTWNFTEKLFLRLINWLKQPAVSSKVASERCSLIWAVLKV